MDVRVVNRCRTAGFRMATPKPGDLIEIFRFGYQHWVVYVGNGYVVHLTTPCKNPRPGSSSPFSVQGGKATVKRERLEDVARGCSFQVNNYLDDMYKPQPAEKIISCAEKLIGKELRYNLLGWNCEHFVTHLRYGKSHSEQVELLIMGTE
ncbi:phospholipase A and acyltransferase 4 [Sciurus carolinensis]|uniref:phospholipase A and acyltransferase 4 n=1 Tax=Sciurus carolinensis TaxID=30640 RepID=UPI001FB26A28|nr:phospholipase A and acyltransferase 4 [Sciurus carolinensis]